MMLLVAALFLVYWSTTGDLTSCQVMSFSTPSAFVPRRHYHHTTLLQSSKQHSGVVGGLSSWSRSRRTPSTGSCRRHRNAITITGAAAAGSMTMLVETSGGMEELQELCEQADLQSPWKIGRKIRQSPTFFRMAGYASIPLGAALGFGLVPSRRFMAHTVGALVTGLVSAVGKSRFDAWTENSAKPAIAQVLIDQGIEDPIETAQMVQAVQESFGLVQEDFDELCTEVYTAYLLGMIKYQPKAKTVELKELENLKVALSMSNLQVGEAHARAAEEWYKSTSIYTEKDELDNDKNHPDRQAMDKLLFLTERALSSINGETPQAFTFEMTRVAKSVQLSLPKALDRVAGVVEPFYSRALKSTRSKLGTQQVSSTMLERARSTLGVSAETAKDMHIACLNVEIRELLGLPSKNAESDEDDDDDNDDDTDNDALMLGVDYATIKFPEHAQARLEQLSEILGLTDTDVNYEIALETTPLYQATALASMKDVLSKAATPDKAWVIVDQRRKELLLNDASSKNLLSSIVMQSLGTQLEEANKFSKVNNEVATYDRLLEALDAKAALISILTKSGWDEFDRFDEKFCNPWDKKSANGFLVSDERIKLYRIFLTQSIRKSQDGKLSDEAYSRILEVKGLLGISDQQMEIQARGAFGPALQKVLNRAMAEITVDYTPELAENMRQDIRKVLDNYRLSDDFLRETGAPCYSKAVEIISSKSPSGIPTKELSQSLEALRDLYKLQVEETYTAHMEYFGAIYKKSILEAMGTTGIIRPEFRDSLNDLQDRLSVSEENCEKLFLEAVQEKMTPMVQWIGSEMERTVLTQQQISERRGKDVGEDIFQSGKGATGVLGLGAEVNIMSDIMELVDFYKENDIASEGQVGTKTIEKTVEEDGVKRMIAEEVPVFDTIYPVTALGCNAIDQQMAELLYRQFVVGGFTSQGPQAARYESSKAAFAGILGLDKAKVDEINSNIGNTVYDNFISNAMKTKGTVDQQDMMFLAQIQNKLGLDNEQGATMLKNAQKKVLSEEIDSIMDTPTPEDIKAFREKCNSMGMDIQDDVGVSKARLVRMFESEVNPGLKSGTITADDASILVDIQESLGIEPEECERMFENLLTRLSKNAMDLVSGEILRGREENTVDLIKELVRYAAFSEGDLGLLVDESTGYKVLNIYEALDWSSEDESVVSANRELLKLAMGLSS